MVSELNLFFNTILMTADAVKRVFLLVVHGHYGEWGAWSPCSQSCEGGVQSRQRSCDSPAPSKGGRDCEGAALEERMCNIDPCPREFND